jgi:hypothetical protein
MAQVVEHLPSFEFKPQNCQKIFLLSSKVVSPSVRKREEDGGITSMAEHVRGPAFNA